MGNVFPMCLMLVNLTSGSVVDALRVYRSLLPELGLGCQKAGNGSEGIPSATKDIGLQGRGKNGQGILKRC